MLNVAHASHLVALCRRKGRGPAPDTATLAGGSQTLTGAL